MTHSFGKSVGMLRSYKTIVFHIERMCNIAFEAKQFMHGVVFRHATLPSGFRAHQFNNFILLLCTITSNESFQLVAAFIIKDKNDLNIPLLQKTIST